MWNYCSLSNQPMIKGHRNASSLVNMVAISAVICHERFRFFFITNTRFNIEFHDRTTMRALEKVSIKSKYFYFLFQSSIELVRSFRQLVHVNAQFVSALPSARAQKPIEDRGSTTIANKLLGLIYCLFLFIVQQEMDELKLRGP